MRKQTQGSVHCMWRLKLGKREVVHYLIHRGARIGLRESPPPYLMTILSSSLDKLWYAHIFSFSDNRLGRVPCLSFVWQCLPFSR
jgi:hypothetical protein